MVSGCRFRRNRGNIIGRPASKGEFALPRGYVMGSADASRKVRMPGLAIRTFQRRAAFVALALLGATALTGCGGLGMTETLQRGYVIPPGALEQIPIGASQDQVLIVLGTPSTVATVNGDVFYYISQKSQRSAAFMPYDVVDQRVVAVYFDKNRKVTRLANYGLKDGKVFDFQTGRTETGGKDLNYLRGILREITPGMINN
jgi:outer membrane protein assembly factor BamE (lipoprotein component of BamABCDE complex)